MASTLDELSASHDEWIACVEEVALNRGLITAEQCRRLGDEMAGTDYGAYVTEERIPTPRDL